MRNKMGKNHNYSFFGQQVGILINSSATELHWFIRCIKKKPDGTWEKPSANEGKVIKISLDETIMILRVLNRQNDKWSTLHSYKNEKTQIQFSWNNSDQEQLWINIGDYSKMLNYAQVQIFRKLVEHFLDEKIEKATVPTIQQQKNKQIIDNFNSEKIDTDYQDEATTALGAVVQDQTPENLIMRIIEQTGISAAEIDGMIEEKMNELHGLISKDGALNLLAKDLGIIDKIKVKEVKTSNNQNSLEHKTTIEALMKAETPKALLLQCKNLDDELVEIWVPKSVIHNEFQYEQNSVGEFIITNWILRKNKIIPEKEV